LLNEYLETIEHSQRLICQSCYYENEQVIKLLVYLEPPRASCPLARLWPRFWPRGKSNTKLQKVKTSKKKLYMFALLLTFKVILL